MKDITKEWIAKAEQDYLVAKREFDALPPAYEAVCFHCQQCVAKALKGFIVCKGEMHPHSHKLADIFSKIPECSFDDIGKEIFLLDQFCIPTRYPDALPECYLKDYIPTAMQRKHYIWPRKCLKWPQKELEDRNVSSHI